VAGCLLRLLGGAWLNGAISVSVKAFRTPKSGEPNLRQLEPDSQVAETASGLPRIVCVHRVTTHKS
jgi:hypothetical protein